MGWEWVRKGVGVTPSGPVKANRGVRARVPALGKVLEGDDEPTVSALYYDITYVLIRNGKVVGKIKATELM